jgi:hypothetical protein
MANKSKDCINSQILREKSFITRDKLVKWANSKSGTDYIVTIIFDAKSEEWVLFYIK